MSQLDIAAMGEAFDHHGIEWFTTIDDQGTIETSIKINGFWYEDLSPRAVELVMDILEHENDRHAAAEPALDLFASLAREVFINSHRSRLSRAVHRTYVFPPLWGPDRAATFGESTWG